MLLNGSKLPLYLPTPADPALQPADALLRESTAGQSQYSPVTQHEKIVEAMARNGHYPSCVDGDEERGHVSTRRGYQNIRARVEQGLTTAVYVFHSARLGRDAAERMRLARELRKLRVPIYSVQQGELRDDLAGGVYALMDQQFSVDLAFKIKNAMPQAVKAGLYPTRTPVGYKRIWPADAPYKRRQPADMVIDEHYGPLVQDIFAKYGRLGWSIRAIVSWLNSQVATYPNPESETGLWSRQAISRMLRKRVYLGEIEWGRTKTGYYDHYDGPVLRSGVDDCGPARHAALIDDRALWEAVQMRLSREEERLQTTTRTGRTPAVLAGFLVCAGCGRPMRAQRERPVRRGTGAYVCATKDTCQGECREPRIAMTVADAAVLREVARLRPGRPWTPAALDEVVERDPHAAERAQTEAEIARARREVERNIKLLKLIDEPDDATLAAFRRDNRELDQRIKSLLAHLEELPRHAVDPIALEEVHARLAEADLAGLIAGAQADGDVPALRELLAATVQSARIVERRGGGRNGRTGWARAAVTWTPLVDLLLEHGYLLLDPPHEAPTPPTSVQRARERVRRYRARVRAERAAQPAPSPLPEGLLSVPQAAAELGITPDALRGAIMRKVITPLHLPEQPRRNFLPREEVERYRAQSLGKRGRRQSQSS